MQVDMILIVYTSCKEGIKIVGHQKWPKFLNSGPHL
jgi:hypothetical protein